MQFKKSFKNLIFILLVFSSYVISPAKFDTDKLTDKLTAGIINFDNTVTHVGQNLSQIKQNINSEIAQTYSSIKKLAQEFKDSIIKPVQDYTTNIKLLPKDYETAAVKLSKRDMSGLSQMGTTTRKTVSTTLQTFSNLVKNISKIDWGSPIVHVNNILKISLNSFIMLKSILESALKNIINNTTLENAQVVASNLAKEILNIDDIIAQINKLIEEVQKLAK